ncbi:GNAT family N-acetyltransferase [Desulfosporosinus sp. FKA]|uniref:GNAT family N-acetyltransferase n=1 Tax=Desulfosporosinus sp. FKA TaxID=1969834 RepID=UPI000B4A53BB|nr:GNAT family N-acetyltransferase [Desulfosporosinus sp. FKA]
MIKLGVKDYAKVIEPLEKLTINTLFAKSVVYQRVAGSVYVDCDKEPNVYYIAHPYGMSLLFGDIKKENFNKNLLSYLINRDKVRSKVEWLQVFPDSWNKQLEIILGSYLVKKEPSNKFDVSETDHTGRVLRNTRINFVFDFNKYIEQTKHFNKPELKIIRTTKEIYRNVNGNVIPKYFWNNEDQFQKSGIGYSLICDGEVASTAFSSFIINNQLEIGIETLEKFRGKGFALCVCSALINYCLENGLVPVWACRLENSSSYQLAQRLGFVPSKFIPYYQLSV